MNVPYSELIVKTADQLSNRNIPISKDSDTLEIAEYIVCLTLLLSFTAVDFIPGQLISLTNPIHKIPGQFVNKPEKILLCDIAFLRFYLRSVGNDG